jgi:hypothetical protein
MASYSAVEMFKKKNTSSKLPTSKIKPLHCLKISGYD